MSAILDKTRTYRYQLTRPSASVVNNPPTLWVMHNPSTADEEHNDPTIRKLLGFTRQWAAADQRNRGSLYVVNLFARRATDPKELRDAIGFLDIVGPDNDEHIRAAGSAMAASRDSKIIVAWGAQSFAKQRASVVAAVLRTYGQLWCLGTTKDGSPRHPLYVPYSQPLIPWEGYR